MEHFMPPPPAAITRVLMSWDRTTLAAFVAVAIDLMDLTDGDPEAECDPFNEGEAVFDADLLAPVNECSGDPNCDGEPASWLERADQSASAYGNPQCGHFQNGEDCEDDDPAEVDDHGGGNVEDEGEREEGIYPTRGAYGRDQRVVSVGHGYKPWDIDRETWAGGEQKPERGEG